MFRLIKLSAYMLLGYFLYELILGMNEPRPESAAISAPRKPRRSSANGSTRQGIKVPVGDSSGAERSETVGRGVVS